MGTSTPLFWKHYKFICQVSFARGLHCVQLKSSVLMHYHPPDFERLINFAPSCKTNYRSSGCPGPTILGMRRE